MDEISFCKKKAASFEPALVGIRGFLARSTFLASSPAHCYEVLQQERALVEELEKLRLRLAEAQRKLAATEQALGECTAGQASER